MEIELVGARELIARLEGEQVALRRALEQTMRAEMTRLAGDVQADQLSGQALTPRTGTLRRAVFSRVDVETDAVVGRVGVDQARAVYGRIHEHGGEIVPTRGKFLAIPLDAVKTKQQRVARFSARELMANPEAFGYRSAFVRRSKGPRAEAVILGTQGARGTLVPLFALVRRVKLPARAFLGSAFTAAKDRIVTALGAAVDRALASGEGGTP